jgi:hypothetical protein
MSINVPGLLSGVSAIKITRRGIVHVANLNHDLKKFSGKNVTTATTNKAHNEKIRRGEPMVFTLPSRQPILSLN